MYFFISPPRKGPISCAKEALKQECQKVWNATS